MAAVPKHTPTGPQAAEVHSHIGQHPRQIVETGFDTLLSIDGDGIITAVSPSLTSSLGYEPEDVVGSPVRELLHCDDADLLRGVLEALAHTPGKSLRAEYRVRHRDGGWRWFEGSATRLGTVSGEGSIVIHLRDVSGQTLAPRSTWGEMSEPEHFIQFYETDAFLLDSLSDYVGAGLAAGDACIVIATREHREGLDARLEAAGAADLAAARASNAYIALDAAETLGRFMVDGLPDPQRFAEEIASVIGRMASSGRRLRIFGEMVALLWAEGNHAAAIRLEALWNDLHDACHALHPFSLCCAYPTQDFAGEAYGASLVQICGQHAHVIPDESYSALASPDERLRAIALLQQKARSLETEVGERRAAEVRTRETLAALLALAQAAVEAQDQAEATAPTRNGETQTRPSTRAGAGSSVAQRLAELTCRVLGCRRVGITVVEPGSERLRAVAVVGLSRQEEPGWWHQQRAREARGARLGASMSAEEVARLRAGEIVILDMAAPPRRDRPNPYGVVTTLVAPMRVGDQLIGILALDYGGNTAHSFTAEEAALAETVARLGALVLERERLLLEQAAAEADILALEAANRRMNEFLSIASHELRTPLTTLKANLQILARTNLKAAGGTRESMFLERSERQVERLARLVEDMIDLARIHEGRLELRPEVCDLATIVREEVELQRQAHPGRTIGLELPEHTASPIWADPDRVGQVLTNLLTNALKYSEQSRPVAVCVEIDADARAARVGVRDEGPGLPPEERERVWELFHRVPGVEVRTGSGVGLGLGLHIARTIVERHGGHVGVESEVGKGSTFWFTLPLVDAQANASAPTTSALTGMFDPA